MTTDSTNAIPHHRGPDLWRLPDVLKVQVRQRRFDPPRRVTRGGVDRYESAAVEFEMQVSEPFPVRALGPVLWVGDVPLTDAEAEPDDVYRFFCFEPEQLEPDAPILLSWSAEGAERKQTPYRYSAQQGS